MNEIVTMVQEGGPWMYLVLGVAVLVPMAAMAVLASHVLRWRVPQLLVIAVPLAVVALGAIGTSIGASAVLVALSLANPAFLDRLASTGYAMAVHAGVVGAWVGALGFGLLAAANGLGLLVRPGLKSDFSAMGLLLGLVYGIVALPLVLWFSGWTATLLTLLTAFGLTVGSTRSPYQDDADKARCITTRVLIGFYGLLGYACNALFLVWYAQGRYQGATLAEAAQVARLQAVALEGVDAAVGICGLMGLAALLIALLQASNRFGDLDTRAWVQGVPLGLAPLLVLPPVGFAAYQLGALEAAAVPWPARRQVVLREADLLPPRLDLPALQPITRGDTLQFADLGTRWNDGPVPDELAVGNVLNIEAGPDVALAAITAFAPQLEGLPLCVTVRSDEVLSCLPLRLATSPDGEASRGVVEDALPLAGLALVPSERGWVLMDGPEQILARGALDDIRPGLPPEPQMLRMWMPAGRTVEDIIAMQKALTDPERPTLAPRLIWRTDTPPTVPEAASGDGSMVVQGLTREQVRAVVARFDTQIAYCYQRTLQHRADAKGSFTVWFTVDATGSVTTTATRDSTLNDSESERCVETRIRNMRFPAPEGGQARIQYPFVFKPADLDP